MTAQGGGNRSSSAYPIKLFEGNIPLGVNGVTFNAPIIATNGQFVLFVDVFGDGTNVQAVTSGIVTDRGETSGPISTTTLANIGQSPAPIFTITAGRFVGVSIQLKSTAVSVMPYARVYLAASGP